MHILEVHPASPPSIGPPPPPPAVPYRRTLGRGPCPISLHRKAYAASYPHLPAHLADALHRHASCHLPVRSSSSCFSILPWEQRLSPFPFSGKPSQVSFALNGSLPSCFLSYLVAVAVAVTLYSLRFRAGQLLPSSCNRFFPYPAPSVVPSVPSLAVVVPALVARQPCPGISCFLPQLLSMADCVLQLSAVVNFLSYYPSLRI